MRYFVESYGCTMNYGEGRMLSRYLSSLGYQETFSPDDADLVVLNTCTVVETTERKMLSRMMELKKQGKEIIVTGCMAKAQPQRVEIRLPGSLIVPPQGYDSFTTLVSDRYGISGPPAPFRQGTDAILPIAQGCLGNCSYCITRFARGRLSSYDPDELVHRFNEFIDGGAKEVLVTAQDTACYGLDIGTTLPELLRSMLRKEGDYRIRIGMMNPNHLKRIADELIDVMRDERVYRFLHVPVQSGSDAVLRSMRRGYTAEGFMELIGHIRSRIPDISIATDLICGFPEETDADHDMSMDLMRKLQADTVNITRFSARPGTDAREMVQIHGSVSSARSKELTELKNSVEYEVNSRMIGKIFRGIATEEKDGTIVRTDNYRPIVVKERIPLGEFVTVKVTGCKSTYLLGERQL